MKIADLKHCYRKPFWRSPIWNIVIFNNRIKPIFFKQKTAYEISLGLVGSEMCIRDSNKTYREERRFENLLIFDGRIKPHTVKVEAALCKSIQIPLVISTFWKSRSNDQLCIREQLVEMHEFLVR